MDNVLVDYRLYTTAKKAFNEGIKTLPEASLEWWKLDKKHKKLVSIQGIEYYVRELEEA